MYNFNNFIKKTDNYSNNEFFKKNNYTLEQLNKKKIYKCKTEKPKINFEQKGYNEIYNHSPGFPSIKTILENEDYVYIIPGGISWGSLSRLFDIKKRYYVFKTNNDKIWNYENTNI
jgi:hypothetical protein